MRNRIVLIKKMIPVIVSLVFTCNIYAQNLPKTFNYQAVARTEEGNPISNKKIVVEISILKGNNCDLGTTCTVYWQETHNPTTNEFGLFSIDIGGSAAIPTGVKTTGINKFSDIDWGTVTANNEYYVKVRVDFGDAAFINGLIDMGITKLQSVPYSLVADKLVKDVNGKVAINLKELNDVTITTPTANQVISWNGTNWINTTIVQGNFVKQDGTSDLTGNWTISNNNISLTNGSFVLGNGSATLSNGTLTAKTLKIVNGPNISQISTDGTLAVNNDASLATVKAVKTYVDNQLGGPWTVDNTNKYVYYNGTYNLGIGTITPDDAFTVNLAPDKGFLVKGTFSSIGNVPAYGKGTRMAFYPSKSAFRAGTIDLQTNNWDNALVGNYSVAFGYDTKANGDYTFVAGKNCSATDESSVAFGNNNSVQARQAVAFGYNNNITINGVCASAFGTTNTAGGSASFVSGYKNQALGTYSTAFGQLNEARGVNSLVIGYKSRTGSISKPQDGKNAFAMGDSTEATGLGAFSSGYHTTAGSDYSLAIGDSTITAPGFRSNLAGGHNTSIRSNYSFTHGFKTTANTYASFIIGQYNNAGYLFFKDSATNWNPTDAVFVIGNGNGINADPKKNSDAFYILKNGDGYMAGTLTQGSDSRLKTNIQPLVSSLNKIMALNGITFNWNKITAQGSDDKQIGVIAQDVEKVLPELVNINSSGYKTVNYIGLIPVLIESIKEQQKQIDELKKTNAALQQDNQSIQNKLENLNSKNQELNSRLEKIEQLLKDSKSIK
jgi:hypothetical protein